MIGCSSQDNDNKDMDSNTTPSESQEIPVESEASDTVKLSSSTDTSQIQSLPYGGNYPQHETYGKGIGAMPGRVVWSHNPGSVQWDGSGHTVTNLGVHEYWNNSEQKLYSRNLGKEEGIELVQPGR